MSRDNPQKSGSISDLITLGRTAGLWRRGIGFKHYCKYQLFAGIDLRGLRILEIGAGSGVYAMWASLNGASDVVALEPSLAGSDESSDVRVFRRLVSELSLQNVSIVDDTFQHYEQQPKTFDLILSHYSINHLSESDCIRLRTDADARDVYAALFHKMYLLLKPGGRLVVVDCTNHSFYSDLGMINPFSPTVEWHKHHPPAVWGKLMTEAGFKVSRVNWMYDNRLLHVGRLLKHPLGAYFYTSMFRLVCST